MQSKNNPVQLYFEMPTYLYGQQKLLLCCGYVNFEFDTVQLLANELVIAEGKSIPHYFESDNKLKKCGFYLVGWLKQINQNKHINFRLLFKNEKEETAYPIGKAEVRKKQKIVPIKPDNVAIVMPTYQPNIQLFRKQLQSIVHQSAAHRIQLIIQDDGSDEVIYQQIKSLIQPYKNVYLFRNEQNAGFYQNIEDLLYQVDDSFRYVGFSDQDDVWDIQKIKQQIEYLENHQADLVYSDLEIVNENLELLQNTFWVNRSNHIQDYHALCVNNVATGSTMLFKGNLLEKLLPFPQQTGRIYHDHWICAFLKSKNYNVKFIDKPLVKYIQHTQNVTGFHLFKKLSIVQRILSFASLIFTFLKIVFKKDISASGVFINQHQKIYFTNVQRLKLFYFKLNDIPLQHFQSFKTDLIIVFHLLCLSLRTLYKKIYVNRFEVSMYSGIIIYLGLQIRYFFRKKNG